MKGIGKLLVAAVAATSLAGCMHHGATTYSVPGDVAVDSLSASRTVLLRVQNAYGSEVRLYTLLGHQANYVAKAMPGETRTWVLDPNLFPTDNMSFEIRPADGTPATVLGPYRLDKGQTVEVVVPANPERARANVHRSTP